jgi:hypothetical protein
MEIPKKIHYCWFGGNSYPELVERCIKSWTIYCPNYEIIEWNESNFDINSNLFVKEAYNAKKWAFVSDYVRLYVLLKYGGIYLDADFELLKNLDVLVENTTAFTGYQEESTIPAAIMGFSPQNVWIEAMLAYYADRHFVDKKGNLDMTTNSIIITLLSKKHFNYKGGDKIINPGKVKLFPDIYFAPYKKRIIGDNIFSLSNYNINRDITYGVHHGVGSWYDNTINRKISVGIKGAIRLLGGEYMYSTLKKLFLKLKLSKLKLDR